MNWFRTIVRLAVVLGAIVTALPTLPPMLLAGPGANDQQSTILQLERDVPELMKKSNVPGVSIALIQRGKTIWVHGFGVKKAGTSQPVTGETVFEAASLNKPVFGRSRTSRAISPRKDYGTDCFEPSDRISELARW